MAKMTMGDLRTVNFAGPTRCCFVLFCFCFFVGGDSFPSRCVSCLTACALRIRVRVCERARYLLRSQANCFVCLFVFLAFSSSTGARFIYLFIFFVTNILRVLIWFICFIFWKKKKMKRQIVFDVEFDIEKMI